MKCISKTVSLHTDFDLTLLAEDGRPLFMDIETTGLSAERNHVYLIGCCFPVSSGSSSEAAEDKSTSDGSSSASDGSPSASDGSSSASGGSSSSMWEFHQWFSEGPEDEAEVLTAFRDFAAPFSAMVHFNGDTFDLPFLHKRAEKDHVEEDFTTRQSVDLLKHCRKLKKLLHTPDTKLKTLEAFLGLSREDRYTGGELIDIYRNYVKHPDPEAERLLLLHNEEDILGMPELLPILTYWQMMNGDFDVTQVLNTEICTAASAGSAASADSTAAAVSAASADSAAAAFSAASAISAISPGETCTFSVNLRLSTAVPQPVFFEAAGWHGILRGDVMHLSTDLISGELRYFFPNYREYYYLPAEDMAVHKSVAEFVEKDHRQKATKETAYIRHAGQFLPVPALTLEGLRHFRENYKGPLYVEASQDVLSSVLFWDVLAHQLTGRSV